MLDVVDAALTDPRTGEVTLFRGNRYIVFAVVAVEISGWDGATVIGTVTLEARDQQGVLVHGERPCRTVWDLATGALGTG